ncbi:MAG: bacillithiol biosynthesis deacetylase BshB1 [Candidatus Kapabacteria bacterium]|nr:bacillithiol biosynthesis deacetylase BshB1 [Candidatus Kapabacteria bacterium]MCS7169266.1 bacillithiol biosynthesis deacetylase BshB1 [Candidatus Kapabacteria bacterium]MDW8225181.1 bacillithiol biosynthesis deacetylase BshB1 [Bacteroidota bacterium]
MEPVDVLAVGAHPDDVEMSCGGTLIKLVREGWRVVIVDCTRGELGSRGTVEVRAREAAQAAAIIGAVARENLGLPDGHIAPTPEAIEALARLLRHYRPRIVLFPPPFERHPDHEQVHRLVRTTWFHGGLAKLVTYGMDGQPQQPYRPPLLFCYMQAYEFQPTFYVDISDVYAEKVRAVQAHASQVYVPGVSPEGEPETVLSRPEFWELLELRARYFGSRIGVRYAEAFLALTPLGIPTMGIWLGHEGVRTASLGEPLRDSLLGRKL